MFLENLKDLSVFAGLGEQESRLSQAAAALDRSRPNGAEDLSVVLDRQAERDGGGETITTAELRQAWVEEGRARVAGGQAYLDRFVADWRAASTQSVEADRVEVRWREGARWTACPSAWRATSSGNGRSIDRSPSVSRRSTNPAKAGWTATGMTIGARVRVEPCPLLLGDRLHRAARVPPSHGAGELGVTLHRRCEVARCRSCSGSRPHMRLCPTPTRLGELELLQHRRFGIWASAKRRSTGST